MNLTVLTNNFIQQNAVMARKGAVTLASSSAGGNSARTHLDYILNPNGSRPRRMFGFDDLIQRQENNKHQ